MVFLLKCNMAGVPFSAKYSLDDLPDGEHGYSEGSGSVVLNFGALRLASDHWLNEVATCDIVLGPKCAADR